MITLRFSPISQLTLALAMAVAFFGVQNASAEDNSSGLSMGRVTFGSKPDDKWLKVDMKTIRSDRRVSTGAPTVSLGGGSAVRTSTVYASSSAPKTSIRQVPTDAAGQPVYPQAKTRVRNTKMLTAAAMAMNSAHAHSTGSCWRYVKSALLKAEVIDSYPKTGYAKQAASELVDNYGFVRTTVSNPFSAPVGSVLVYGGSGAGHIEIRTLNGFVSDFVSAKPSKRPLIGVYVKQ